MAAVVFNDDFGLPRSDLLGRITSIKIGKQPELPEAVRAELEKLR